MKLKSRKGVSTTYRLVFAITAAGTAYTTAPVKVTGR
jgi:hypothetical protein